MANENTQKLSQAGQSIWLDDLSRSRIDSGNLADLCAAKNVVGVTTNPAIFAAAIGTGTGYAAGIAAAKDKGLSATEAVFALASKDVRDACDVLLPIYENSAGKDGRVSIEVSPEFAHDAQATVRQSLELWQQINKPNLMIKIPATNAGLEAIAEVTAHGISVNVTLIFSLPRYREVINAYQTGLERARQANKDISKIHSVASFFVSRLDTAVDTELKNSANTAALNLCGAAGIANARLAYQVFQQSWQSERAKMLLAAGANKQRPLWASTGVKDPNLSDTLYVDQLIAAETVNTMPEATLNAFADHGTPNTDTITDNFGHAARVLDELANYGIDYTQITTQLEAEGLEKFAIAWNELLANVSSQLHN